MVRYTIIGIKYGTVGLSHGIWITLNNLYVACEVLTVCILWAAHSQLGGFGGGGAIIWKAPRIHVAA